MRLFSLIYPQILRKSLFDLIKSDKMWIGYGFNAGNAYFETPHAKEFAKGVYNEETGLVKFRNVTWFTNLDISKRHEELLLYENYNEEVYQKYVNFDAIEVGKVKNIPCNYTGLMGVPITFFDKYNPEQFEIIGSSRTLGKPMREFAEKGSYMQGGPRFYLDNGDGTYRRMYDRLVIKNKKLGE